MTSPSHDATHTDVDDVDNADNVDEVDEVDEVDNADEVDEVDNADEVDEVDNADEVDRDPAAASAPVVGERTVGWVLLVAGLVGFAAAFVLAVEKYWLLTNPFYTPSCSVNATISCGPVMSSWQAAVFGFPNPYLGIAGFAVVAATGAMLLTGGRLASWYAVGLQVGAVAGTVFVAWLMVQSLTVIHALCPYCMAAWAATFATIWYVTLANLGRLREQLPARLGRAVDAAGRNHSAILAGWLLIIAVLVAVTAWGF